MVPFLKEYKPGKHNAVEWVIIGLIAVLLFNILQIYMGVNVWRQDSMYYVSSYDDKLATEGRWINHLFFRYLQQVPASLAILLSYFSVIYFCFQVAFRVSGNAYMALAFGMLCALIPVLPVQLEWPETLLIGFLLLAASPYFASIMPRFVFFPVMAVLFFGTFSAFFFVMPLLFLKGISFRKGAEIIAIWIVSFVFAYFFTNLLVWMMTGDAVQIADWRNPTPARDIEGLLENISRIAGSANSHFHGAASFLREEIIASLALIGIVTAFVKRQFPSVLIGVICGLAVYVTVIPVGIYVQSRTLLVVYIAFLAAFLLRDYQTRRSVIITMVIVFVLSVRMAAASYESVLWYKTMTNILVNHLSTAIKHKPEEVDRLFIMVEIPESAQLFQRIEKNIDLENRFSEGFSHPQYWVPALKSMGYKQFRVCADLSGWDCSDAMGTYEQRQAMKSDSGIFISSRLNNQDLVIMLNPQN